MKLNQPFGPSTLFTLLISLPALRLLTSPVLLHQKGLLGPEWFFQALARVQRVDRKIIPGEYELHAGMRPTALLAKLVNGEVYQHSVTIPEGYNVVQIADILDQKGLADKREILRLNRDPAFIRSVNIKADTLEGYLFPDTYRFARYTAPGIYRANLCQPVS